MSSQTPRTSQVLTASRVALLCEAAALLVHEPGLGRDASAAGRAWSSTTPASPVTRCRPRSTRTWASPRWDVHTGILEDVLNGVEPRPFWTTHAALEKAYAAAV